jgi:hypothetical protein
LGHDVQRPPDSAKRRHLHHDQVGGTGTGHPEGIVLLAHAFVGRNQYRNAGPAQLPAHFRQAVDVRHRLLRVFQPRTGQPGEGFHRFRDAPASVGVHADGGVRQFGADGGDPGGVVVEGLSAFRHLDLDRIHPAKAGQDFRHARSGDGRHCGVDGDAGPERLREPVPAGLDGGGKPAGGLRIAVFRERAELAPALGSLEQQRLTLQDAAELHPHGQRHHARGTEQLLDRRQTAPQALPGTQGLPGRLGLP